MNASTLFSENFQKWCEDATASQMVCILRALARELEARHWPTAGSCNLAAAELQRFCESRALREELRH